MIYFIWRLYREVAGHKGIVTKVNYFRRIFSMILKVSFELAGFPEMLLSGMNL